MSRTGHNVASTDNADRGRSVEIAAADRLPIVLADDEAAPNWFDAVLVEDRASLSPSTPVEIKSCLVRLDSVNPRRGRWWIDRANHDQLLEAGGAYVLAVVDRDDEIQRLALMPAREVDVLVDGRWTPCGDGAKTREVSCQLPWSALFDDLEEPDVDGGRSK